MFQVAFALCTLLETLTPPKALVQQGIPVYNALTEVQVLSPAITSQLGLTRKGKSYISLFMPSFSTVLIPVSKHVVLCCSVALVHPLLSSSKFYVASVPIQIMAQGTACHGQQIMKGKHLNEVSVLTCFILQKKVSI